MNTVLLYCILCKQYEHSNTENITVTSNLSSKSRGAAVSRTLITWVSFVGSEEPSLKLSRSAKLQRTNTSPISNCQCTKLANFISRNKIII